MAIVPVKDLPHVQYEIVRHIDGVVIAKGTKPRNDVWAWQANWDDVTSFCRIVEWEKPVPICTLAMLRCELHNVIEHGLIKHQGDWYHEWARTSRGTLSFVWHY